MSGRPVLSAAERLEVKARQERRVRRRRLLTRAGWTVAVLAPCVFAGWVLLASPWLVVQKVVVSGEERLATAEVLAAAQVQLGAPLARVDTQSMGRRVRELGPVLSVEIRRAWPDTLELVVVEREPVAAMGKAPSYTLLDETGAHLGLAATLPAGVVVLAVAHPAPGDAVTTAALTVLGDLPRQLRTQVVRVAATTTQDVTLRLRDGRSVIWGGTDQAREKARAVIPLLALRGRVFDVSTPTVVTRR